ncbi:MAG TPA: penicillin-binding protein 2 [Anaerolineaceae bacterium]|nr:penicillin-binding protein 2 [Anaerolineaceae bacterium]
MKTPFFQRYLLIASIFLVIGIAIIIQMVRIQHSEAAAALLKQADMYGVETRTIYPERGSIFDRQGHLLAGNETVYEVGVDLAQVTDPDTIAATVSSLLGVDYIQARDAAKRPYVEGKTVYAVLADFATSAQVEQLTNLQKDYADQALHTRNGEKAPSLAGLVFSPHLKRSYPEKELASNVVGFYKYLDREGGRGFFGVEEKYNDLLSGTPQRVRIPYDPNKAREIPQIPPGASLILTIDREIQAMTERVLDHALKTTGAVNGTIIIEDPNTGELLAIATTPRMDLNQYWKFGEIFPNPTPFDRTVGTTYEPGSVFKILTMASALDNGAVTPDTNFVDTGTFEIGGAYIHNWDGGAWGPQDMTGCLRHSLNVCLAWTASKLGPDNFYKYIQAFGIGHQTGVDLAGEVSYPIRIPGDGQWILMDLGTNSFGQGIAVTPIEMVMAISAVANNDGKMMGPHVLKAMIDNGRQYNTTPQVVGTPIKAETAKTLTGMLTRSLEEESSDALVPGYRVAGKTGTAEIPGPGGYESNLTNASFAGWGPIDDPRFLVYIWLEKPESSIWGSVVAAPVFSETVKNLVVLMDIPPDNVRQTLHGQ